MIVPVYTVKSTKRTGKTILRFYFIILLLFTYNVNNNKIVHAFLDLIYQTSLLPWNLTFNIIL